MDRIAALVRKVLHVPVGLVSLVDRDGQVFPGQAGLPSPWRDTRCTPLTHSFCQYVVRSGEPLVVADARLDSRLRTNLAIVDINVVAYAGVPLVDQNDVVVGSLCAIDTQPREWTQVEVDLLSDLAAACSAELQLRTAAVIAAEAEVLSGALLELSDTLSDTLTVAEISVAVSKLSTGRLGAAFGGITVFDPLRKTLTYVDLGALPPSAHQRYAVLELTDEMPSAVAARTRTPLFFESAAQMEPQFPDPARALRDAGAEAAVYLPLVVGDRVVGTVGILWSEARTFGDADRSLLLGLTRYTAQAVDRAMLLRDRRDVAATLQAAMLSDLPVAPGATLAARYLPARRADAVGGDWYDAFALAGRPLVVSVGDVEGHDTEAAAVMGQIRSMLRALTSTSPTDPAAVFEALDDVMTALPLGRLATGILAAVSRQDSGAVLSWTSAGHPPPLIITPDRPAQYLFDPPDRPLGVGLRPVGRHVHEHLLTHGSTMLLYTDGLIERRDADLQFDALLEAAERHADLELGEMIDAVIADLLVDASDDDVVLFALRVSTRHDHPS
ncbi:GAF domain-containing SpoIIE family protein phosphatase [uncultured Jatrophihabitans sp.]|uniref:GAF domain-containing SpoIIE family protein phosphatase n=1 Tax=uncultured Jatrophihabitans sp. TaxID=1610747 RepID=UPI0035CC8FB9